MPNYVYCTLTVTGSKKAVAALQSAAKGYDREYVKSEAESKLLLARIKINPCLTDLNCFAFMHWCRSQIKFCVLDLIGLVMIGK